MPEEVLGKEYAGEVAMALVLSAEYRAIGSIEHLRELAQAERDGRLVVLPCKVGAILYEADGEHGVITHTVTDIHWVANTRAIDDAGKEWADFYTDDDISSAYQTREEAEEALEAQKDD